MAGLDQGLELRQLISEFYARFMQVIVESRVSMPSAASGDGPSSSSAHTCNSSAFNLMFGKSNLTLEKMGLLFQGVWEPFVIDIVYLQKGSRASNRQNNVRKLAAQGSLTIALESPESEIALLLERWTVEFVQRKAGSSTEVGKGSGFFLAKDTVGRYHTGVQSNRGRVGSDRRATQIIVGKNLSILMRSLYSTVRFLPAHKLSRILSTRDKYKSRIGYRIFTIPPPLSESNKKDMTPFAFPSADCCYGHLRMSVTYRQRVPKVEQKIASFPPHMIMDYVERYQLKQLPGKKVEHVQSLPSAWRLSSFEASNIQRHQPSNPKQLALKGGQNWAHIQLSDPSSDNIDCPFAIIDRRDKREKVAKLFSVKSDVGAHGEQDPPDASSESLMELLRCHQPLRRTRENLVLSNGSRQTVADALKELQLYKNFKDHLPHKCT